MYQTRRGDRMATINENRTTTNANLVVVRRERKRMTTKRDRIFVDTVMMRNGTKTITVGGSVMIGIKTTSIRKIERKSSIRRK